MNSLNEVFKNLGSEQRLEEILTEFYKRMAKDILLGFFFTDKDLTLIIKQQKAFLLRAMGVRKNYRGKSPRAAHRKIPPILKGHFDRRLVILRETLLEAGLPSEDVQAWVDFENTFRTGIVEEEAPISKRRER